MLLGSIVVGYTTAYVTHGSFSDVDVSGKAFWITPEGEDTSMQQDLNLNRFYSVITGLSSNTNYSVRGAYFDEIIDAELLAAQFGIFLSTPSSFLTATPPSFGSVSVTSTQLDVGVGTPVVVFDINGSADTIQIERSPSTGTPSWELVYAGALSSSIAIPTTPGSYIFRVRGSILLPDGATVDTSSYVTSATTEVTYSFTPPTATGAPTFSLINVEDGVQRYDLQVSWTHNQGSGPAIREFYLEYIDANRFASTGWTSGSTIISAGTATEIIIPSFPFNIAHRFRVGAVAWGPEDTNTTLTSGTNFTLTQAIVDSGTTITRPSTGLAVNYSGITAFDLTQPTPAQTFRIDAATGNVSIGKLVGGVAPVSVDGVSGNVNVSGQVISGEIISASFVLANLTGQDNPTIRTSNKTSFGQSAEGMWVGYDSSDSEFKFDLGSPTEFIRWDGDTLLISGQVRIGSPTDNVAIEDGVGTRGSGIYAQAITGFTTFNVAQANSFFTTNFGSDATPVLHDILTQFNPTSPTTAETRRWNGTAWIASTLTVQGDAFIEGTVTTDKLAANEAFLNDVGADVIYDSAAFATGDPEANFKMKIDLSEGSIIIR
jgi:hypothetical protein